MSYQRDDAEWEGAGFENGDQLVDMLEASFTLSDEDDEGEQPRGWILSIDPDSVPLQLWKTSPCFRERHRITGNVREATRVLIWPLGLGGNVVQTQDDDGEPIGCGRRDFVAGTFPEWLKSLVRNLADSDAIQSVRYHWMEW
jgi:hypothetical protein